MATGPEAWQRHLKEEKEREKAVKNQTTELHQNYRTTELNEADVKLKAMKQEERRKQQETAEMWRQFKKLEIGEDEKKLSHLKQQERKRVQETERMYHSHQNNTIQESDMKLSLMRQEERKRMHEHEAMLRKYNHTPGFQKPEEPLRRSSSQSNLQQQQHHTTMSSDNEDEIIQESKVPEKAQEFAQTHELQHKVVPRTFRRSSIGTMVSGNWMAAAAPTKPKETVPPKPKQPEPPVAEPMDTVGNASVSSIQSARSVFSKGNSTPSIRPLYVRKDSAASSIVADPIDQEESSQSPPTLETPEPSERVEATEQTVAVESKASTMKAALSMFTKNTTAAPLLPPKHNSYVSSKAPARNGSKPEQPIQRKGEQTRREEEETRKEEKEEAPIVKEPEKPKEESPPPVAEEKLPEEIKGDELLANPATVVRLDVLFSFGLLTSSDLPVFTNYMNAVEQIVKKTCLNSPSLTEYAWYDPVYPPFVQEYKTDDSYKDPSGRGNVRRLLVIAAIPIFLTNGISVKQAREGVCQGLQGAINSGEFIRLAKTSHSRSLAS